MTANNHLDLSIIIPCYNESKNIPILFDQIFECQKKINFEVIIINNGSNDDTDIVIKENFQKVKNIKILSIKKNIGFGDAIRKGIISAKSKIICYTHGDLQIDLDYCLIGYQILKEHKEKKVFVKSKRLNRNISDKIFTLMMGLFNTIVFKKKLFDIHAQPNIFYKPDDKILKYLPNDMSVDLFFYILFLKKNFVIKRFNIMLNNRIFGEGANDKLSKKIRYSFQSITNSLKVRKLIKKYFYENY